MKCPHCLNNFHPDPAEQNSFSVMRKGMLNLRWHFVKIRCPACMTDFISHYSEEGRSSVRKNHGLIFPPSVSRAAIPEAVGDSIREDFVEAAQLLGLSPKASAAMSRRCLQQILHAQGFQGANLFQEIDAAVKSGKLPIDLADDLDTVRNIGNFAAHPIKSENTGEIIPVENGEAEWNLDVIEELIEHFYVRPAKREERRSAFNAKLSEAGKPLLKETKPAE